MPQDVQIDIISRINKQFPITGYKSVDESTNIQKAFLAMLQKWDWNSEKDFAVGNLEEGGRRLKSEGESQGGRGRGKRGK